MDAPADAPKRPGPPRALAAPGRRLWREILGDLRPDLEFDKRELAILRAACQQEDLCSQLGATIEAEGLTVPGSSGQPRLHPAAIELRQGWANLARLLGALGIPSEEGQPITAASQRARRAADARWAEHRARRRARD